MTLFLGVGVSYVCEGRSKPSAIDRSERAWPGGRGPCESMGPMPCGDGQSRPRDFPNRQRRVTLAGETDMLYVVDRRRHARSGRLWRLSADRYLTEG